DSVVWPMVVSTAVWLPGLLAVIELLVRDGRTGRWGDTATRRVLLALAGAGIVTMQFLAGHLEMSLYLLLTAGLYAGIRLVAQLVGGGRQRQTAPPSSSNSPDVRAGPQRSCLAAASSAALLLAMVVLG